MFCEMLRSVYIIVRMRNMVYEKETYGWIGLRLLEWIDRTYNEKDLTRVKENKILFNGREAEWTYYERRINSNGGSCSRGEEEK